MCKVMNRSFISVILGGFGGTTGPAMAIEGEQIAIDSEGVARALNDADSIIIVPAYDIAVAQAKQAVSELTRKLRAAGKTVRFAIHPVAGRLLGHMNVLLAEAKVAYAIVNPAAEEDLNSPIADMPVLQVWNGLVTELCRSPISLCHLGFEGEGADTAEI